MTSQLLKRYEKTGQKAAMIFTSSDYANIPIPGIVTYSACKSFTSFLGEGLHSELKDKVELMNAKEAAEILSCGVEETQYDERFAILTRMHF